MSSISTLSPASTYPDLFQIANAGKGLTNVPSQVQDGIGNLTNITISTNYINFDRGISQFQIDSIPLTADINTLNNISDVANGAYVLLAPNAQLTNGLVLTTTEGISLSQSAGNVIISPSSVLAGLQQLNAGPNGIVVNQGGTFFGTVDLISDATINIVNPDGVSGNPTFNVVPDTSVQRVNVQLNGVFQSRKSQLNFIPGAGAGINIQDDPSDNRTNITISVTPGTVLKFVGTAVAATTSNLNATYNNGAAGVGATLTNAGVNATFTTDGVTPNLNDRILVWDQNAAAQNGLYNLTDTGSALTPWILTRSSLFNSPTNIKPGDIILVLQGNTYAATGWVETEIVNTVGTDPILFDMFSIGGGGIPSSFELDIDQPGHGLSVGQVVRIDNLLGYVPAQADNPADSTSVVGIVVLVPDGDHFTFQFGGIVTVLNGLQAGFPYFLDPAVAGGFTSVKPTVAPEVVLPLFYALSPTTALWEPKLAVQLI